MNLIVGPSSAQQNALDGLYKAVSETQAKTTADIIRACVNTKKGECFVPYYPEVKIDLEKQGFYTSRCWVKVVVTDADAELDSNFRPDKVVRTAEALQVSFSPQPTGWLRSLSDLVFYRKSVRLDLGRVDNPPGVFDIINRD